MFRRTGSGAPRCERAILAALGVAAAVVLASAAGTASGAAGGPPLPRHLADTGLYADFASKTVDARNLHYTPQYPLWSDGAAKSRWIYLPPGGAVDARDPDRWTFPVGTKIWKEFSWSRRVETRLMERTRAGWIYGSYVWTPDGSDAVLAPATGLATDVEVAPGRRHRIPAVADCHACHRSARAEVLGFSALQLSPDRDPLAPHAEPLRDGDPTLPTLVAGRRLRRLPARMLRTPPRVAAETPRGRAALGYLHANCSICHDSVGPMRSLGVSLRHALGARSQRDEPAIAGVGRATRYAIPGARGRSVWIDPGSPGTSAALARMASRTAVGQMPPLGTEIPDAEALALVRGWIEEDLREPRR